MITKEMKAGTDRKIWQKRGRHRFTGSTGSDSHSKNQRPAGSLQGEPEGSSLQKRSSEDGRSEKKPPRIPESKRYRALQNL